MSAKIKPLLWIDTGIAETFHADSILGIWSVWELGSGYFKAPGAYGGTAVAGGLDGAKKAAQSEYERIVMSVFEQS